MENINDITSLLEQVDMYIQNDQIDMAIEILEAASTTNDQIVREKALSKLVRLDIKIGRIDLARKILNENCRDINSLNLLYGTLEAIEYNYTSSLACYYDMLNSTLKQHNVLLKIANAYVQLGEHDMARKIYETLLFNNEYKIQAKFGLIFLSILEHDYNYAYKILQTINASALDNKDSTLYRIVNVYLRKLMGNLNRTHILNRDKSLYTFNRILADDDQLLLSHLAKHVEGFSNQASNVFFRDMDLKKLLLEIREIMPRYNSNRDGINDQYFIHLNAPIGRNSGIITSDIRVATLLNSDRILTMYPVILSNQFDREGLIMSEELKSKRMRYINE